MPKPKNAPKTKKNQPEFAETLNPAVPLVPSLPQVSASASRLIGYGSLAVLSILVGIGAGAVFRSFTAPAAIVGAPGIVAAVTNPAISRVLDAKTIALPSAASTNLQAVLVDSLAHTTIVVAKPGQNNFSQSDNLQPSVSGEAFQQPVGVNGLQPGYSAYGIQGSVGTQRTR